jgi:hypothetical protein
MGNRHLVVGRSKSAMFLGNTLWLKSMLAYC